MSDVNIQFVDSTARVRNVVLTSDSVVIKGITDKVISYPDFMQALSKAVMHADSVSSGAMVSYSLPNNTFKFSVGRDELEVVTYHPECTRNLIYFNSTLSIRVPNIVISHRLKRADSKSKWMVDKVRYFCTDLPSGQLEGFTFDRVTRGLYLLPLSNTYAEGNMCYGANQMPNGLENNLRALNWYHDYLWASPFNDDLGIRAVEGTTPKNWYEGLRACAANNEPFPYSRLRNYQAIV